MPLKPQMYLADILRAGEALAEFTTGKTFEDYQASLLLRSAVERQLEIVGEALNQLLIHAPEFENRFVDRRKIKGFRNVLAHEYGVVDNGVVWGILESHLPGFLLETQTLMTELNLKSD
jgi:uncharacterized protein with HEPN domain